MYKLTRAVGTKASGGPGRNDYIEMGGFQEKLHFT